MIRWRFGEFPDDGEAWLKNPEQLYAYVEYASEDVAMDQTWRRLMVVTKSWLQRELENVRHGASEPRWAMIPTMLVVPDGEGEALRRTVDAIIQQGGFDEYATPVEARS